MLKAMVDPADPYLIASRPYLLGKRAGDFLLETELNPTLTKFSLSGKMMVYHANTFPMGAIAPINYMWRPTGESSASRQLWVWIHPSALPELMQVFNSIADKHDGMYPSSEVIAGLSLILL